MNVRVAIFARPPVEGAVKTRLAASIGARAALKCYRSLLSNAIDAASGYDAELWITDATDDPSWARGLATRIQPPGDLGTRMLAAFEDGVTVLIGADVPLMSPAYIASAVDLLARKDLVLGPTEDGGYCLIAMREPYAGIFEGIAWGSERVLEQTLVRASGLRVGLCEMLWDVDVEADYRRWQADLERLRAR